MKAEQDLRESSRPARRVVAVDGHPSFHCASALLTAEAFQVVGDAEVIAPVSSRDRARCRSRVERSGARGFALRAPLSGPALRRRLE
jgi:hypothetical protein